MGEKCDDGNADNGDGCSSDCTIEAGFSCSNRIPDVCSTTTFNVVCSDIAMEHIRADQKQFPGKDLIKTIVTITNNSTHTVNALTQLSINMGGANGIVGLDIYSRDIIDGNSSIEPGRQIRVDASGGGYYVVKKDKPFILNLECSVVARKGTADANLAGKTFTKLVTSQPIRCGNGIREENEQCDDGNTKGGDGCSPSCKVVSEFYECTGDRPSVCTLKCGNGKREGSEKCDDGNTKNGDGCSSICKIESGFQCSNDSPNVCRHKN